MGCSSSLVEKYKDSSCDDNCSFTTSSRSSFSNSITSVKCYTRSHSNSISSLLSKKYNILKEIGEGTSGSVNLIENKITKQKFACKIINASSMNDDQSMNTELNIMMKINHENIVQAYEIYQSQKCLWIIMELGINSLGNLYEDKQFQSTYLRSDDQIKHIFKQLLCGLHYLHSNGIVHRDLKLDNIIVTDIDFSNNLITVKLADFGLAKMVDISDSNALKNWKRKDYNRLQEKWGNRNNFAPELIKSGYGSQVDLWSLGCILYEILYSEIPFNCSLFTATCDKSMNEQLYQEQLLFRSNFISKYYSHITYVESDLILSMLEIDPVVRKNAIECLKLPFFTIPLYS
eukprot:gene14784-19868_t